MANFLGSWDSIDRLTRNLSRLEINNIAPDMLKEAGTILERAVQDELEKHHNVPGVPAGGLQAHTKLGNVKNKNGVYTISVRPSGKDAKGYPYMNILAHLEYGTGHKGLYGGANTGIQRATPVLAPAVSRSRAEIEKAMKNHFERAVKNI